MHGDRPARTNEDRHPTIQLLLVQGRAARDEEIHLQLCGLMDQARAAAFANGPPKRTLVQVEVRFEGREERGDVRLVEGDDKIDVYGRSRFPGKRTGQGASDRVRDPQRFEKPRYSGGDG